MVAPLARQHVRRQKKKKDEEKGEENNSRYTGKTECSGGGGGGGKFSIKLHGNGGWLTRGVGWTDGRTDERTDGRPRHGRDAPIVIQIAAARTSVAKSFRGEIQSVLKRERSVSSIFARDAGSARRNDFSFFFFYILFEGSNNEERLEVKISRKDSESLESSL